jgi:hypothetical protein
MAILDGIVGTALNPMKGENLVEQYGPLAVTITWCIVTVMLIMSYLGMLGKESAFAATQPTVVAVYGTLSGLAGIYLKANAS